MQIDNLQPVPSVPKFTSLKQYSLPSIDMRRAKLRNEIKSLNKQITLLKQDLNKKRPSAQHAEQHQQPRIQVDPQPQAFDFLTKPELVVQEQQSVPQVQISIHRPGQLRGEAYIHDSLRQLTMHYNSQLKKKFDRREEFPHLLRRKIPPKLLIQNNMKQQGCPLSYKQHLFRVMTKEKTPVQLEAMIPTFSTVKDSVTRNVLAYLRQFRPFLESVKEQVPKAIQDIISKKQ